MLAVAEGGLSPSEFWRMSPAQFWLFFEAKFKRQEDFFDDKWAELYEYLD